eukprot:3259193-Pyramimonas_sp.AAC.1
MASPRTYATTQGGPMPRKRGETGTPTRKPETQGNQNKASERPAPATRKPTRRAKRRRRGKGPTARKGAATRGRQAAHGLRRRFS